MSSVLGSTVDRVGSFKLCSFVFYTPVEAFRHSGADNELSMKHTTEARRYLFMTRRWISAALVPCR